MECTYSGNFNKPHGIVKKRRMIRPVINNVLSNIIDRGISCESFRENEALRLMKPGNLQNILELFLTNVKNYIEINNKQMWTQL